MNLQLATLLLIESSLSEMHVHGTRDDAIERPGSGVAHLGVGKYFTGARVIAPLSPKPETFFKRTAV